ncbi:MAG: recombinase family protein [Oscillospiraceae bacterium]|nr:recombinase family protein [Oscillospiraceae bacterium]
MLKIQVKKVKPANLKIIRLIKVAAYARVSSGKDSMLQSLAAQVSYYSDLIQKRGDWEFAGIYADEATTGTKDNRAEFKKLIADCKEGKIDMVITKSISRFARNTVTLLETVRMLKERGVDVYFERERIHSMSNEGELMLTILALFAQEESRSVSENCKWRIKKKFENGEPVGFVGMYGYEFKNSEIIINEKQASVIRQIFDWYISGDGTMKIAKRLNELEIPTYQGGKWSDSRVNLLISNERLTGNSLFQKKFTVDHLTKKQKQNIGEKPQYFVSETHPAIISQETFEEAKQIRKERAARFNVKDTSQNRYPFSGKIVCEKCGKHYKRKKTSNGFSWQCSTFLSQGKTFCKAKAIPEQILENIAKEFDEKRKIEEVIKEIKVSDANRLVFFFSDGNSVNIEWTDRSRRESWTPETKEKARLKSLKKNEITSSEANLGHLGKARQRQIEIINKRRKKFDERNSCYSHTGIY